MTVLISDYSNTSARRVSCVADEGPHRHRHGRAEPRRTLDEKYSLSFPAAFRELRRSSKRAQALRLSVAQTEKEESNHRHTRSHAGAERSTPTLRAAAASSTSTISSPNTSVSSRATSSRIAAHDETWEGRVPAACEEIKERGFFVSIGTGGVASEAGTGGRKPEIRSYTRSLFSDLRPPSRVGVEAKAPGAYRPASGTSTTRKPMMTSRSARSTTLRRSCAVRRGGAGPGAAAEDPQSRARAPLVAVEHHCRRCRQSARPRAFTPNCPTGEVCGKRRDSRRWGCAAAAQEVSAKLPRDRARPGAAPRKSGSFPSRCSGVSRPSSGGRRRGSTRGRWQAIALAVFELAGGDFAFGEPWRRRWRLPIDFTRVCAGSCGKSTTGRARAERAEAS